MFSPTTNNTLNDTDFVGNGSTLQRILLTKSDNCNSKNGIDGSNSNSKLNLLVESNMVPSSTSTTTSALLSLHKVDNCQPSSTMVNSSIHVPHFLSTLLRNGNFNSYHSLLTNQSDDTKQSIQSGDYLSQISNRNSICSTVLSKNSCNDDQTVSTSGITQKTNSGSRTSVRTRASSTAAATLNNSYGSHQYSLLYSKSNKNTNRNLGKKCNNLYTSLTGNGNYRLETSNVSTSSSILLNAHQNDTHDSLAASMPLLSSYLRSKSTNKLSTLAPSSNNDSNCNQTDKTNTVDNLNCNINSSNCNAVRFGRVPKREKAKILAAMQKVNAHSLEKALAVVLEDEMNLMQSIIKAHEETCDYTKDKVAPLLEAARSRPIYAQCPQMTCPLNPSPVTSILENGSNGTNRLMEDFSERFSPAIHGVVEFAKRIPGFSMLAQEDQVTLLKAGVFEVLLVRLACMFDSQTNSMVCLNGLSLRRDSLHSASNARFLLDSMFDFAERLNSLRLTDQEIGLFCAVVVIAPDRPGLRNTDLVQKINKRLEEVLQKAISSNHNHHNFIHNNDSTLFLELTKKIPDLRTLNALHSEKLLGKSFGVFDSTSPSSPNTSNGNQRMDTLHTQQNGISTTTGNLVNLQPAPQQQQPDSQSDSPDRWSSTSSTSSLLMISHSFSPNSTNSVDDNVHCPRSISPPNLNQNEWMVDSKDNIAGVANGNFGSPRSISSSVSSDDNNSNGLSRKGSISSSSSSSSSPLAPKLAYMNNYVRVLNSNNNNGSSVASLSNNSEQTSMNINHQDHESLTAYNQYNKSSATRVDSPTDSGIESGKERDGSASTPTTSVCSSPQSAIEENNNRMILKDSLSTNMSDSETGSEKQESIDDMPVLKRALQAPPLVNTNKLMDEAYRYHKKFRAARSRDTEPHSPTTTTNNYKTSVISSTPAGVITSHSSLASTHSTLLKTLEQPSRYMNEQQLKRTDLIHNIIMNTEAVQTPATTAPSIMMILKDHASSSQSAAIQQFNSQHQQYSDNHNQAQLIYSSSPSLGLPTKMENQKDGQQVTVLYTAPTQNSSNYNNDNGSSGSGCPFSSGRIVSNPLLAHNQQQQSIYRTSLSPQSYLIEQQNNQQTQPLLVIGSTPPTAAAPAHSPARPSSSSSCYSNGGNGNQSPYCHLVQRCYTATIAPSLASNGPIMLQTAASSNTHQSGSILTSNESDCQPLNLSKKAASANTSSRSQSPSYSFTSSNPNPASRTGTSISCSPLIKIEVDQNA